MRDIPPAYIDAHSCIRFIALSVIRLIQLKVINHLGRDPDATKRWTCGLSAVRVKAALLGFQADA